MQDRHPEWEEELDKVREVLNDPSVEPMTRQLLEQLETKLIERIFKSRNPPEAA